jgi:hypothetical protein
VTSAAAGNGPAPYDPTGKQAKFSELDVKLFGQHMIMCNEEREQMKAQPDGIPKRLKMTQNVQQDL